MYAIGIFLTTLAALSPAAPFEVQKRVITGEDPNWKPATTAVTTCEKDPQYTLNYFHGPYIEDFVNAACAAILPPCAYQDRLTPDAVCIQTVDWPLGGPQESIQNPTVVNKNGDKIVSARAKFSITPGPQSAASAGAFMTIQDCFGYFAYILAEAAPKGCANGKYAGSVGSLDAGDAGGSLKGTMFNITILPKGTN